MRYLSRSVYRVTVLTSLCSTQPLAALLPAQSNRCSKSQVNDIIGSDFQEDIVPEELTGSHTKRLGEHNRTML